jgi:predicted flap endonuclease-1-like 5' DNA nuclease
VATTICHKVNPMDLKQLKGVGPSKQDKLKLAGITRVEDLARADVAAVAHKSGLPAAQVKDLKHRAAALALLEDLKGMGPGSLETLSEQGAKSVRELYAASADWLAAEIKVAQAKLADLKDEAEVLARHVAEEAKTAEGRARLAEEGLAAAQSAARKAKATGQKALAAAERQRDLAVAKAKDLQKRAPAVLHQAQVTVKEAEVRLKAAVKRSEEAVLAEAKKAKARTERVVGQAKARLNKAA